VSVFTVILAVDVGGYLFVFGERGEKGLHARTDSVGNWKSSEKKNDASKYVEKMSKRSSSFRGRWDRGRITRGRSLSKVAGQPSLLTTEISPDIYYIYKYIFFICVYYI